MRTAGPDEFGGIGTNVSIENLWNDQAAIDTIDQTYEIDTTSRAWNKRDYRIGGLRSGGCPEID
jgi:hypothetical protein